MYWYKVNSKWALSIDRVFDALQWVSQDDGRDDLLNPDWCVLLPLFYTVLCDEQTYLLSHCWESKLKTTKAHYSAPWKSHYST